MSLRSLILAACCCWIIGVQAGVTVAAWTPPRHVSGGDIRGRIEGSLQVYRGIPYAAPPVGPGRWKPPQPVSPWRGVRDCTEFGPACPQPAASGRQTSLRQSEDCLYLNVWTPATPTSALPVMVWFPGGGSTIGSGAEPAYDGAHLARRGVVLVTFNSRLGPFGYFAHPLLSKESPHHVSGNYGMLDQISVLQWIQKNIAAFGGDPHRVTVFGQSSGAAVICRLMVSPLSRGLFAQAIAESGSTHRYNRHLRETWYGMQPMEQAGRDVAERLGCEHAPDPLAALRARTPAQILEAAAPALGLFGKGLKFSPIIDGWAIPDDPNVLFEQGREMPIPFIVGSNADEVSIFAHRLSLSTAADYLRDMRDYFSTDNSGDSAAVLARFPPPRDADARARYIQVLTMASFTSPARFLARTHGARARTWLYLFSRISPGARGLGAYHGAEVPFVFDNLTAAGYDPVDRQVAQIMSECWVRFASTGDPGAGWAPFSAGAPREMTFGNTPSMRPLDRDDDSRFFEALRSVQRRSRTRPHQGPDV